MDSVDMCRVLEERWPDVASWERAGVMWRGRVNDRLWRYVLTVPDVGLAFTLVDSAVLHDGREFFEGAVFRKLLSVLSGR